MRTLRTALVASALAASLLAAPAASAAGRAPEGGLFPLTGQDDIVIENLVCDDSTVTEVHLVAGGIVAWVLGEPDRMYVLTSITGESELGHGSFTQHYGQKRGLGATVECSMDYAIHAPDWHDAGVMTVTMARVW